MEGVRSDPLSVDASADADRQLIRSNAAGSGEALADLYDRHASVVFGLARRITGQLEDAEEVGWLVMLARTRAIDRLRARTARPDQVAAVEPDSAPPLSASSPDPEQITLSGEDAHRVREALTTLPEAQRSLLDLAFYEGLTHAEIAARTGMPLGTVKTRLRTAMSTLRSVLGSGDER